MKGCSLVSLSILTVIAGVSVTVSGCSGGSDQKTQFSGSTAGQLLQGSDGTSADQTASQSTLDTIQAQRRADNALLAAALAGLENDIAELRKRDNELADKIAAVDKTLSERIAVLENRIVQLEAQDKKFAEILEAVKGDISGLQKEDLRLAQSIVENTRLIAGLRSDLDNHLNEFTGKVREVIKNDPDLQSRFEAGAARLEAARETFNTELTAAKQKAERDLAAAQAVQSRAIAAATTEFNQQIDAAKLKAEQDLVAATGEAKLKAEQDLAAAMLLQSLALDGVKISLLDELAAAKLKAEKDLEIATGEAKLKAEQDLAAAVKAQKLALNGATSELKIKLEEASQAHQKSLDDLKKSTDAIDKSYAEAVKQFQSDIDALESADNTINASLMKLQTDLATTNETVAQNHAAALKAVSDLGDLVSKTYATKTELKAVETAQKTLRSAFLLLNGVPDAKAAEDILKADPALADALNGVQLTLQDAKADHQKIIQYGKDFQAYKESTDKAIKAARDDISAGNANVALLQKLTGEMAKMSILAAKGEEALASGIAKAVEQVQAGKMSQADFETLQTEFAKALDERQTYESTTQVQLKSLGDRLTAVEVTASLALDLAKAAGRDIRVIKGDISALYKNDEEIRNNLEALDTRLTGQIEQIDKKVIEMLDGKTPTEFAQAFRETVATAAKTQADLKSMDDQFGARIRSLEAFKTQAASDIAALQVFQDLMTTEMPKALAAIQDFTAQHWAAVGKVIQTLAPFQAQANSPADQIAVAFRNMALQLDPICGFNPNADFPALYGDDYFAILGKRYLEAIVYEGDAAIRALPIFFGINQIAPRDSLLGQSLSPLFETRIDITNADGSIDEAKKAAVQTCNERVNEWVANVLYGDLGAGFREMLLADGNSLKEVLNAMVGIARQAQSPLTIITQHISGQLPGAVRTLQAEVARHAQEILELQEKADQLDRQINEQNGIAQNLAAAQLAIQNLSVQDENQRQTDAQLSASISTLRTDMSNSMDAIRNNISSLGNDFNAFRKEQIATNGHLYQMISALAAKAGLNDIANEAMKRSGFLISVPAVPPTLPTNGSTTGLGLLGAGFDFFTNVNAVPGAGIDATLCKNYGARWASLTAGGQCLSGRNVPTNQRATVLHESQAAIIVSSAGANRVVVSSGVSSSWGSSNSNSWKQEMDINLETRQFTLNGQTVFTPFISGSWQSGFWMIPIASVLTPYLVSQTASVAIRLQAYSPSGTLINTINLHTILFSPIVLNFAGNAAVPTKDFASSGVRFDLDGDGSAEKVGWLNARSTAGLLSLDLNNNGIIDNGRELFGQGTMLHSGKTAADGYVAMQAVDANKDGYIDANDPMFSKLTVWFDRNLNGASEAGELVSLKDAKVAKISVKGTEVRDPSKRAKNVFENDHRYESRFWGPESCGSEGCSSFDIFFSKHAEVSKR